MQKLLQFRKLACRIDLRLALFALALLLMPSAHAQSTSPTALISTDASGNITFSPGFLAIEIIGVVVAAIAASMGLYFAWTGTRWIYRIIKGTK